MIYAYLQVQITKSKNTAIGEVIDKIEYKNVTTYKIKYMAKDCVFMLIYNSTDQMEIGAKVSVKYIEYEISVRCDFYGNFRKTEC